MHTSTSDGHQEAPSSRKFLDALAAECRRCFRAEDVMQVTARLLGEFLQASRCAYAQVEDDEDHFNLFGDYSRGVPSIVGRYAFSDFGDVVRQLMVADRAYVNVDVDTDPRTAGTDLRAYRLTRIQAVICVPLHKAGRFSAAMAVHQDVPRRWTDDEVGLVQTVVDRCWEALDRIRSEMALRDTNQRLSLALDAGELGDWSWDVSTDVLTLSARADAIFGLPPGMRTTWTGLRERLHPDDRDRAREAVEQSLHDRGVYALEYRVVLPGGLRWVAAHGKGVYGADGSVVGMIGIVQDVTQRRSDHERAAGETELLKLLQSTGRDLLSQLDLGPLLQRVTDTATQLTGASFGAFFYNGRNTQGDALLLFALSGADKAALEPLGHPRPTPLIGQTFAGGPPVRVDDVLTDRQYGQMAPHFGMPLGHLPVRSYLAVSVIGREGDVIGSLFFGHRDPAMFSERSERLGAGIAAQAAIAIDNARLYEAAKRATAERDELLASERQARRDAERANALKDEFLASLSHELRTPLSAIMGWVHVLKRKLTPDLKDLVKGIDVIERSARAQTRLIEDLLDMSRITSGKLNLEPQEIGAAAIVENAIETMQPVAAQAGITLVFDTPDVDAPVIGDRHRLQQVVWNLLSNAVKFSARGSTVRIAVESTDGEVHIAVADSGVGIEPGFLPHLFERFRQADGSTTRRFGGLGLGLTIAKHIVELHRGRLVATSAGVDRGATFRITLPAAARSDARDVSAPAPVLTSPDLTGVSILVVDDEPDAREMLCRVLEECGAEVRAAEGAAAALAAIAQSAPHVLISDIGMPGIDGYELIRRVRGNVETPRLPAIALTAFARGEDRQRALGDGFDIHLAKPVDTTQLLSEVARAARQ